MKILTKITYYGLVVLVGAIGLLLLLTLMPAGNLEVKIVKSGSMEPAIKTGGIVFVRGAENYKVNDVITFGKDTKTQIPTTHRIVSIEGAGQSQKFMTKGDANDVADPTFTSLSEVKGKVVGTVPYVGFVLEFARKPLGFILLVGVPASIVILDELYKIWIEVKRMRRKKIDLRNNLLDLRMRQAPASRSNSSWKMLLATLVVFGTVISLGSIKSTVSYYNEYEFSAVNTLSASNDFGIPAPAVLFADQVSENVTALVEPLAPEGEVLGEVVEGTTQPESPEILEPLRDTEAAEPTEPSEEEEPQVVETALIENEVEQVIEETIVAPTLEVTS